VQCVRIREARSQKPEVRITDRLAGSHSRGRPLEAGLCYIRRSHRILAASSPCLLRVLRGSSLSSSWLFVSLCSSLFRAPYWHTRTRLCHSGTPRSAGALPHPTRISACASCTCSFCSAAGKPTGTIFAAQSGAPTPGCMRSAEMTCKEADSLKKWMPCLRCGRLIWTDRCHRTCRRCRVALQRLNYRIPNSLHTLRNSCTENCKLEET